jgi:hypothetical protein
MCVWRHATHYKPVCFVLFFFQFCDLATVVMRSQEELAKFGYRLKRKVEIVRIMQYFSELEPIV